MLVVALAALNHDVRRQIAGVLAGNRSSQVEVVWASLGRLMRPVLETLSAYWGANPWLVGFGVIGLALFVIMLRA